MRRAKSAPSFSTLNAPTDEMFLEGQLNVRFGQKQIFCDAE